MLFDNPIILDIYIRASNRNEKDWSLAELQLTPQEYNVCCEYANSITKSELAEYFNNSLFKKKITALSKGVSEVALIGFFLLLISAEIIRREGSGKRLWSVVYQKLSRDAQDTLFSNNIQPNQKMKEAIEKAAKEFQLRNVFGVDGLKEWFDTVYLQIGFTHDGLINHLPEWLCRIEPVAIQYLLGKQGNVASESFKKTWILLKNFRNRNVTEQYVRNLLSHNPWILPEWIDELMDSARKDIPISEYTYQKGLSQSEVARADSPPFLSHPLLRWKPSQRPEFFCEIQNLANLDLNQPDYDIKINNKPIKRLYRQDDGTYSCEEMELVLPKPTATIYVSMVDNVHNIVQEFSSLLWDSNEDLTIFDLKTGEMLQPIESQMFLDRDYALLLAEDLVIRPAIEKYDNRIQNKKLYYLHKNWAATLEIPELFWKPCLGISKLKQDDSNEIMIFCQPSEVKLGQCITLQVKSAEGIEILSIRVAAHPFDLSQNRFRITITPNLIHSDPITQTTELKFKFGLRKGNDNYIINKMLTIKIVGVAYDNEGQWEILNPHKQFTVEQAKFGRFRIFGVRGYLFEGQLSIRQVQPQKSESIGVLAGLGDRLTVRQNNDSTSEELMILAEAVVDIGILQSVKIDGNLLSLYLPYVLEDSDRHRILWIGSTGEIVWLTVDNYEHDDENNHYLWQSEIPQSSLTRPLLIGISYNGECLGSWWESGWLHLLENPQEPEKIAYLIRWLKLPVLSSKYLQAVQKFAREYADEILDQWFSSTSKKCTMAGFNLSIKNSENWMAVISEIFPNYPFTPAQQKLLLPKWLRLGTLVAHKEYGVGCFDDVVGEFLRIQYADAIVHLPISSWKDLRPVVDTNHALDFQSSKRKKLLR